MCLESYKFTYGVRIFLGEGDTIEFSNNKGSLTDNEEFLNDLTYTQFLKIFTKMLWAIKNDYICFP